MFKQFFQTIAKNEKEYNKNVYKIVQFEDGKYGVRIFSVNDWTEPVEFDNFQSALNAACRWTKEDEQKEKRKTMLYKECE